MITLKISYKKIDLINKINKLWRESAKHETNVMKRTQVFVCFGENNWKNENDKRRKKSEKVEGGEYSFIRANHETEYILRKTDKNQFKWFKIIFLSKIKPLCLKPSSFNYRMIENQRFFICQIINQWIFRTL